MRLANGTWTETLNASAAVDAVCAAITHTAGMAAEALFLPNECTAGRIRAIIVAITPLWKPRLTGKAHQGSLVIATREGDHKITRDEAPRLFGLQVQGEPAAVSGKTIFRFLEVYAAAWAWVQGRADRIADLLVSLLQGDHAITLGALRERARGTEEDPGPEWAKSLRRHASPEAFGAKLVGRMYADLEGIADPGAAAPLPEPPARRRPAHGHAGANGDGAPGGHGGLPVPGPAGRRGDGGSGDGCLTRARRLLRAAGEASPAVRLECAPTPDTCPMVIADGRLGLPIEEHRNPPKAGERRNVGTWVHRNMGTSERRNMRTLARREYGGLARRRRGWRFDEQSYCRTVVRL